MCQNKLQKKKQVNKKKLNFNKAKPTMLMNKLKKFLS